MINRDYGKKTTAQITALSGSTYIQGDRVFNTDLGKYEYYTGEVWTNDDCVVLQNDEGSALSEGYFVQPDAANNDRCELANDASSDNFLFGVVYRGGANGSKVVIAIQGIYNVYFTGNATSGQYCNLVTATGNATSSSTPAAGTCGIVVETRVGAGLAKVNLQPCERF